MKVLDFITLVNCNRSIKYNLPFDVQVRICNLKQWHKICFIILMILLDGAIFVIDFKLILCVRALFQYCYLVTDHYYYIVLAENKFMLKRNTISNFLPKILWYSIKVTQTESNECLRLWLFQRLFVICWEINCFKNVWDGMYSLC